MPITQSPLDITVDRGLKKMTIVWSDQTTTEYAFADLRAQCPCAHCDQTKHGGIADPLDPKTFQDIGVQGVEEVGRYALRFTWSDGHDSGIYSYEYLKDHF